MIIKSIIIFFLVLSSCVYATQGSVPLGTYLDQSFPGRSFPNDDFRDGASPPLNYYAVTFADLRLNTTYLVTCTIERGEKRKGRVTSLYNVEFLPGFALLEDIQFNGQEPTYLEVDPRQNQLTFHITPKEDDPTGYNRILISGTTSSQFYGPPRSLRVTGCSAQSDGESPIHLPIIEGTTLPVFYVSPPTHDYIIESDTWYRVGCVVPGIESDDPDGAGATVTLRPALSAQSTYDTVLLNGRPMEANFGKLSPGENVISWRMLLHKQHLGEWQDKFYFEGLGSRMPECSAEME